MLDFGLSHEKHAGLGLGELQWIKDLVHLVGEHVLVGILGEVLVSLGQLGVVSLPVVGLWNVGHGKSRRSLGLAGRHKGVGRAHDGEGGDGGSDLHVVGWFVALLDELLLVLLGRFL